MKQNLGNLDRLARFALALLIGVLHFTSVITGTLGMVLLVLAIVFAATSLISFCPLYTIFGFNTCPKK